MSELEFRFNEECFNKLFPFFVLIDSSLKIKGLGKSISKLNVSLEINSIFTDHFSINRPYIENPTFEELKSQANKLIILDFKKEKLALRGQLEINGNYLLFLGSPWFTSMNQVIENNLTFKDFALNDPLLDLLHVLNNQELTTNELKELVETINQQKNKLKKDKKELDKLSLVASANKNGVLFTDANGEIFWCNEAFLKLTGYSQEEVIGKTPVQIGKCKSSNKEDVNLMLDSFYKGINFDLEIIHRHKFKEPFWARVEGQPILDNSGNVIQYFAIIEDITSNKEINQQLIDSENRLKTLIVNLQSGILLEDQDRKILLVNNKFCSMFGIEANPEQMKGYDCSQEAEKTKNYFKNPDYFVKRINEILQKKETVIAEEIELVDGRIFERSFMPIIRGNKYEGHLWSYEDVTIKKRYKESLEAEREKYSNIIANMNMGLLEVDNEDKILFANQTFCEMSGYSISEIIGNKASDLLVLSDNKEIIKNKKDDRKKGISDSYEIASINKKGEVRHWLISGAPNYNVNGEIIGSIGVHLDITEKKKLEIQKEQLLKKLEKQNEQLNDYAKIVSHDLKSPLRSIHSLLSWIKEDNDKQFDCQTLEYFSMIENKVEKMDLLIEGILTYSKIDEVEVKYEKVNINEIVKNIIGIIHIPESTKVVIKKELPTIRADRFRMQQLFQNIISNAVNYIDKKEGIVEVDFKEGESNYIFSIEDNGPGIAKENQEKIFNTFQSFSNSDKSKGLGLSIVKKVIEFYNGKIWIESEINKGTTFFLSIPKK